MTEQIIEIPNNHSIQDHILIENDRQTGLFIGRLFTTSLWIWNFSLELIVQTILTLSAVTLSTITCYKGLSMLPVPLQLKVFLITGVGILTLIFSALHLSRR